MSSSAPADPHPHNLPPSFDAELPVESGRNATGLPVASPPQTVMRRRRVRLPLILFGLTCLSTFFAGATHWLPTDVLEACSPIAFAIEDGTPVVVIRDGINLMPLRQALVAHWADGLIYMGCVLAILLAHEMGHFVATLIHRIPATLPYFIPLPISPIGTLGAVIGMDGSRADRRETFDVGIAGPLAGLVLAVPIMLLGLERLDLQLPESGGMAFELPLGMRLALDHLRPSEAGTAYVWVGQLNPYLMAGWVGLLITGLNMMPVSQLDGGHVLYTLFGRRFGNWFARAFLLGTIAYIVYDFENAKAWALMTALVVLLGPDHPPTRNDRQPLGWFRVTLGAVCLAIPVLCFPPRGFYIAY